MVTLAVGGSGCTLGKRFSDGRVEGARIEPGIYPAAKKKKMQTDACKKIGHVTKAHSCFC